MSTNASTEMSSRRGNYKRGEYVGVSVRQQQKKKKSAYPCKYLMPTNDDDQK
jgi:hypothetical protein